MLPVPPPCPNMASGLGSSFGCQDVPEVWNLSCALAFQVVSEAADAYWSRTGVLQDEREVTIALSNGIQVTIRRDPGGKRALARKKARARSAVQAALASGRLKRPDSCWLCSASCKVEGHHVNYDHPLALIWLCQDCHRWVHKQPDIMKMGEISVGG